MGDGRRDLISSRVSIDSETGCWIWSGYKNQNGYGRVKLNGRQYAAHRLSYEAHVGDIPLGMFICHKCDNPPCVNPDHLFCGTPRDNAIDMTIKGRGQGPKNKGGANGRAKLTIDQVNTIKSSSEWHHIIAERYGVSRSLISMIKNGYVWGNHD